MKSIIRKAGVLFPVLCVVLIVCGSCSLGVTAGNGLNVTGNGTGVTFTLDDSVVRQVNTDSGNATPSGNVISILGSGNITTSASGNQVIITGSGGAGADGEKGDTGTIGNVTADTGQITAPVVLNIVGGSGISTSADDATDTITISSAASGYSHVYASTGSYLVGSGTQVVSGVGFEPKLITIQATYNGTYRSNGSYDGTHNVVFWSLDNASNHIAGANASKVVYLDGGNCAATVSATGADGFTLTWVNGFSDDVYYQYVCVG